MTNSELLKGVAEFVGLQNFQCLYGVLYYDESPRYTAIPVPRYTARIDLFIADVWPHIENHGDDFVVSWGEELVKIVGDQPEKIANASARDRCMALMNVIGEPNHA